MASMNATPKATRRDDWVMGQGIRSYRPSVFSLNRITNRLFAPSARSAFPGMESAVVIQQKKIPDVSFWQGLINWDLMSAKTDTIIIRAGQNTWEDEQFRRNLREAIARRMIWTVYFFYDDRIDPGRQAALLISLIKDNIPPMEVIIDWENTFGGNFRGLANVVAMMQAVEAALPVTTALYTGYWWFRDHSNAIANASQYAYLKTRPLHLAWYTDNAAEVLIPFPWLELWLWQFGTPAEGRAHGAESQEIDMNFVNMTDEQFYNRYGECKPPPDPQPEEDVTTYKLTTLVDLNIRAGAGIGFVITVASGLKKGDLIESYERIKTTDGAWWYRIAKITRNGLQVPATGNGWASAGSTGGYMRLDEIITDPIPDPSLPAYFIVRDPAGNEARYNKQ